MYVCVHVCHATLLAAGSGHYAYINASSAVEPSAIAVLDTDVTTYDDAGCFCVYLDYHMRGDDVGALAVLSVDASGGYDVEWGVGGGRLESRRR